jgi:hypothetical protein
MLPVAFRDCEMLLVALANPTNVLALDDLARCRPNLRVEPVVVTRADPRLTG